MDPTVAFSGLLPSFADRRASITATDAFQLLYRDENALQNFRTTKTELPLHYVVQNERFLVAIAQHEPGLKIDYLALVNNLSKLKSCHGYCLNALFETFTKFLKTHDYAVATAARFINFDLHLNILRSYYQPAHDLSLLRLFPTSTPEELQEYLTQAKCFNNTNCQMTLAQKWQTYHVATENAFAQFAALKSSAEMTDTFDDLNKLLDIWNQSEALRHEEVRLKRIELASQNATRIRNARNANQATCRSQIGQAGRHRLRTTMVNAVVRINNEQNVSYVDGGMAVAKVKSQATENGWTSHPDTWNGLRKKQNEPVSQSDSIDIFSSSFSSQGSA